MFTLRRRYFSLKLRWKFFFALTLFALTPVLLVSFVMRSGGEEVKEKLSGELRALLKDQVRQDLAYLAENHAQTIRQDNLLRKTILSSMAANVRTRLGSKGKMAGSRAVPLFNTDYSIPRKVPADLIPDKMYTPLELQQKGLMSTTSGHISFSRMAFYLPPDAPDYGVEKRRLHLAAKKLLVLEKLMSQVLQEEEQGVYRAHVVLADGLFATFPGHADLPEGYDPRTSRWYQRALQAEEEVWTSPLKDVVTGRPVATMSMAVRDKDGTLMAVVAMDILFEQEGMQDLLGHSWSRQAAVMMVYPARNAKSGRRGLRIVAHSRANEGGVWHIGDATRWVEFATPEHEDIFMDSIATVDVGTTAMPWEGVPSYWAWAPYKGDSWFLTIVPVASVMQLPDMVRQFQELAGREQERIAMFSIAGVILLSMTVAIVASRRITAPMKRMIRAAERLSRGDFSAQIDVRTGDERDRVIEAFNTMGPRLAEHLETQKTLAVAQEVQANFLPKESPHLNGWDISGASRYCEETGGDYYDFHDVPCEDGKCLGVLVGDVSGHGIPSALLMTTARALLRGLSQNKEYSKAERITRANTLLTEDTFGTGRFMTLFAMELSSSNGDVCWVRAGHDPALCYSPQEDSFSELGGRGLPLGVLPDTVYEEMHTTIADGMVMFIGTDGVWEAERVAQHTEGPTGAIVDNSGVSTGDASSNSSSDDGQLTSVSHKGHAEALDVAATTQQNNGSAAAVSSAAACRAEMYGKERLCDCIRRNAHKSAEEIRDAIIAEVEAWQGGTSGDDDITLVILKKVAQHATT